MVLALALLLASCGPSYVGVNTGYARPYYGYGYGYRPYGFYRPYGYYRPPVVVRPRYYAPAPAPRYYNSPNGRSGFGGGNYGGGYGSGRSRGPR